MDIDMINQAFLPIGSVVTLQGGDFPLMVYGRMQKSLKDNQMWEYVAVPYPEGHLDQERTYVFNQDQIKELLFLGFQTPQELILNNYLVRAQKGEDVGEWPPKDIKAFIEDSEIL